MHINAPASSLKTYTSTSTLKNFTTNYQAFKLVYEHHPNNNDTLRHPHRPITITMCGGLSASYTSDSLGEMRRNGTTNENPRAGIISRCGNIPSPPPGPTRCGYHTTPHVYRCGYHPPPYHVYRCGVVSQMHVGDNPARKVASASAKVMFHEMYEIVVKMDPGRAAEMKEKWEREFGEEEEEEEEVVEKGGWDG